MFSGKLDKAEMRIFNYSTRYPFFLVNMRNFLIVTKVYNFLFAPPIVHISETAGFKSQNVNFLIYLSEPALIKYKTLKSEPKYFVEISFFWAFLHQIFRTSPNDVTAAMRLLRKPYDTMGLNIEKQHGTSRNRINLFSKKVIIVTKRPFL